MRSFDLFVNCCFCGRFKYTFFLIFVTCTLAKKKQKNPQKTKKKKRQSLKASDQGLHCFPNTFVGLETKIGKHCFALIYECLFSDGASS